LHFVQNYLFDSCMPRLYLHLRPKSPDWRHASDGIEGTQHDFPFLIPAKAEIQRRLLKPALSTWRPATTPAVWIPACAGMTKPRYFADQDKESKNAG
jgi:hypothetical protein